MPDWLLQQPRPGNFVLTEGEGVISRDTAIFAASTDKVPAGTILGKITASGKLAPYAHDATDGTETPVGILYAPYNGVGIDTEVVVVTRLAEVIEGQLFGITPQNRASVVAHLANANIILR